MGSAEVQGELWGRAAEDWSALQESHHGPLFETMLDAVDVDRDDRFLDVGCGSGGASLLADDRGAVVTGLDASAPMIRIAKKRLPSADFRLGDLEQLPFPDESFDVVFAANSIQFAANPLAALEELGRVAASKGRVVVGLFASPEQVDFRAVFEAVSRVRPTPPSGHGPFTLSHGDDLEKLMIRSGLEPIESGEIECPFSYPNREAAWKAIASSGPSQSVMDAVGEDMLRAVVLDAFGTFETDSGDIRLYNSFRYVTALPGKWS